MSTSKAEVIPCVPVPGHDIETNSSFQGLWCVLLVKRNLQGMCETLKVDISIYCTERERESHVAVLLTPCIRSWIEEMEVMWQRGVHWENAF